MIRDQSGMRSVAIDVTSASWVNTASVAPIAIHCNADTTITGALAHDASETQWILPMGTTPYSFKSINTSSTTKSGYKIIYGQ